MAVVVTTNDTTTGDVGTTAVNCGVMQRKMSNNSISTYKFKPFQFTELKMNLDPQRLPFVRSGNRMACNNACLLLFGYSVNIENENGFGHTETPYKQVLWKYCFDLDEYKIIKCQNVPQESAISPTILSGNIIIINEVSADPFRNICSNRMCLGNLANAYKENGMSFEELKVSGDVPLPLYEHGIVMDGIYIYAIGGTYSSEYEMNVRRFDLNTRKWELLHKSLGEGEGPKPRCQNAVAFYKDRIYIIDGKGVSDKLIYNFSKIYMFDVATKKWQLLPAKHDHRVPKPGYPADRNWHGCVQCPDKSNLVYICGGHDGYQYFNDVWRFDLDTFQWEKLIKCIMPRPVYFHSTAITPSGRMYCYGGRNGGDMANEGSLITSAWIKIPKLKVICWEAMLYYFKEQMFESSDECLKKIGLPQEYYERIIEDRRIC